MVRVRQRAVPGVLPGVVLGALLGIAATANAQRLVEWTEEAGELGLGYPVPIPVDTMLPFDGFRTYAGLHARHQDLMLTTPVVDGRVIGQTRAGRDIWVYLLGDGDSLTAEGTPEPALMVQGGIHAREWQSPEVVTGIMEWLTSRRNNAFIEQYLLENTNLVMIPVLNIDGFQQTQRYPKLSYLGSDPGNPSFSPRDGRMRRKNMDGVDEDINTADDHLGGIDLNRNHPPFWASSGSSSNNPNSIVYHGTGAHSEPESQAMADAALLGPEDRLRIYTDVHSFGQVYFSERTLNTRRNLIQTALLADMSQHHVLFPGNKFYFDSPSNPSGGIGSTDEYFARTYEIPSWTLEIEPSGGNHPGLPGQGADYGGLRSNGHDGFILPESQIRRVRENLASSFMVAYYHQAGPPAVKQVRVIDSATGAAVYVAEWDVISASERRLSVDQTAPLVAGGSYEMAVTFNKPMRWRTNGAVDVLPGQGSFGLRVIADLVDDSGPIVLTGVSDRWTDDPAEYHRYRDDTFIRSFTMPTDAQDDSLVLDIFTADMVGQVIDANPATVVDWQDGHWIGYEDDDGMETDSGGHDLTLSIATAASADSPFLVGRGSTAAYFDPTHEGEGFLVEILSDGRAVVYWFTYDEAGNQRWYTGVGDIIANEIVVTELLTASGGIFGPAFDPADVELVRAGDLTLRFAGCGSATARFDRSDRVFRQDLTRLTNVAGLDCEVAKGAAVITGSWLDPAHAGEGFVVQALANQALIYWFSYDTTGNQAWFFGTGPLSNGSVSISDAQITAGGMFGDQFDPSTVTLQDWGTMQFQFGCEDGSMTYESVLPEFGSGSQTLTRLTTPDGAACAKSTRNLAP